jgi:predicted esterase
MAPENSVHLFDTPFYKSTLTIRSQLVSPALSPENVFPWIKEIKTNIKMSDEKILLVVGEDDLVVPKNGGENLKAHLEAMGNTCVLETPRNLPHHVPELAASHIKSYLKKIGRI